MELSIEHHRLIISYKGTNYFGWQELGDSQLKPTIQSAVHHALKKICKYQDVIISAASRTDAGVHAQGQVLKITIPIVIESQKLLLGMNSLLPDDIRILECEPCSSEFNPNKDSKSKKYHYYFCTDAIHNPVLNDTVAHTPSLEIELMQEACKLFIGEHNFSSFAKRDVNMHSSLRRVVSCEILATHSLLLGSQVYYLEIVGTGFLRYMVRYIAGALFSLGKGQITLSDISEALASDKEKKISSRAKSKGLHLIEINY
ncbi:MAG: tRNA pseudouridine(38-40) synthase TruA [Campylobacterota bacterium]|nr:tRNA pseudouridine(38-40) synthase TruA [Campylobacterota bacterium]